MRPGRAGRGGLRAWRGRGPAPSGGLLRPLRPGKAWGWIRTAVLHRFAPLPRAVQLEAASGGRIASHAACDGDSHSRERRRSPASSAREYEATPEYRYVHPSVHPSRDRRRATPRQTGRGRMSPQHYGCCRGRARRSRPVSARAANPARVSAADEGPSPATGESVSAPARSCAPAVAVLPRPDRASLSSRRTPLRPSICQIGPVPVAEVDAIRSLHHWCPA